MPTDHNRMLRIQTLRGRLSNAQKTRCRLRSSSSTRNQSNTRLIVMPMYTLCSKLKKFRDEAATLRTRMRFPITWTYPRHKWLKNRTTVPRDSTVMSTSYIKKAWNQLKDFCAKGLFLSLTPVPSPLVPRHSKARPSPWRTPCPLHRCGMRAALSCCRLQLVPSLWIWIARSPTSIMALFTRSGFCMRWWRIWPQSTWCKWWGKCRRPAKFQRAAVTRATSSLYSLHSNSSRRRKLRHDKPLSPFRSLCILRHKSTRRLRAPFKINLTTQTSNTTSTLLSQTWLTKTEFENPVWWPMWK
jgi:hypothetical protein